MKTNAQTRYDAVVIGAGFGGLAAALELARSGARVALFEYLKYPGGCASTFTRRKLRFESGATLFSGFDEGQLFARLIDELDLDVTFMPLDPIVSMRTSTFGLDVPRDRDQLIERFAALPGVDGAHVRTFFARQQQVANVLWELFDDPALIPPFGIAELARHIARSPRYLPLAPLIGQPLIQTLRRWGVADCEPLRTYLNAVCQITVQASIDEAESPFALAAMDYYFRGTGHIHGGIGELAAALVGALERLGVDVFMPDGVTDLERADGEWLVRSHRREVRAQTVVANLLPQSAAKLVGHSNSDADRLAEQVEAGWSAAMLYLAVEDHADLPADPHHYELVSDNARPFIEGNHLFVSLSGRGEQRGPAGERTATVSTHVPMPKFLAMSEDEQALYIASVHERMRHTLTTRLPELAAHLSVEMTASPRTFERFTQRPHGFVGGIPRRAGLHNYRDFLPRPLFDDLYLVGDTVFPGQSTLATTIGGLKVGGVVAQRLTRVVRDAG